MIKETLRIKNVGPLTDAWLDDIRPIMVLVGKSGSGKSLIVKILAMMRHVAKKQIIRRALKVSGVRKSKFRIRRDSYLQYAGIAHLIGNASVLEYTLACDGMFCKVRLAKANFDTEFGGEDPSSIGPFIKVAFICDSRNLVASWARKGAAIQSKVLDNYFGDTYELWDEAMNSKMDTLQNAAFLGVKLNVSADAGRRKLLIEDKNGRKTLFEHGASGQKSSIPVAMIVRYLVNVYSFKDDIHRNYISSVVTDMLEQNPELAMVKNRKLAMFSCNYLSFHIEEPELSLDPETQLAFADDLLSTFNLASATGRESNMEFSVMFTTHSPYWVTALNTIVEEGKNAFSSWDRVGGYLVAENGALESLRDETGKILLAPNMDDATDKIDARYNQALERRCECP